MSRRPIPRDAEATRARLLEAAIEEFAARGIAGARVDRIAAAARSNKAQIYHYYGSKDGLFDAVLAACLQVASDDDYFDADDLPETAGRIHDQFADHPQLGRIAQWYRLERAGEEATIRPLAEANAIKVAKIRAAQQAGTVTSALAPDVLLGLVVTLATSWEGLPPEFATVAPARPRAERRAVVVDAVRRLVAPESPA